MRRINLVNITVDERLKDALYVRADGRRISRPVILDRYSRIFRSETGSETNGGPGGCEEGAAKN
jgi:hypothetical protein